MRFILSALKSGYDIQNIVVISSDNNLLLKAKENGLVYRKMPETYFIKEELSKEEKEIKALSRNWSNIKIDSLNLLLDLVIVNLVFLFYSAILQSSPA